MHPHNTYAVMCTYAKCKVYISRFSQFDKICEGLSCKFVNITIQTHNTSTQIVTLILRNVCLNAKTQNFML